MQYRISIARTEIGDLDAARDAASRIAACLSRYNNQEAESARWWWKPCGDKVLFVFTHPHGPTFLKIWLHQQNVAEDKSEIIQERSSPA
jgi:hypothetical protein